MLSVTASDSEDYFAMLSVELIQQIILQVICPSDLLSLALTNRRMCSMIIPDFLVYHQLGFYIRRKDVWEHLNERPLLCSRVKYLDLWVCESFPPTLPQSLMSNPVIDSSRPPHLDEICSALTKMTYLNTIALNNIPIYGEHLSLQEISALAAAVYDSGCNLEHIELILTLDDSPRSDIFHYSTPFEFLADGTPYGMSRPKMLSDSNWLSSVKTFKFHLSRYPCSVISKLLEIALYSMVNLTHLTLSGDSLLRADPIGLTYYWPKLECLSYCQKLSVEPEPQVGRVDQHFDLEFIRRHHRLHTMYLEGVTLIQTSVDDNNNEDAGSSLQSFAYIKNIFTGCWKNALPLSILKNLSHLTLKLRNAQDLDIFFGLEMLESCVIESCTLTRRKDVVEEIIARMVRGCRNIKKLYFQSLYFCELTTNHAAFSLFQGLSQLTHLLGIESAERDFPGHEGDILLKKLYQLFPRLCYIDCYDEIYPSTFGRARVELRRDDVRQQMTYKKIPRYLGTVSCDYDQWGDFDSISF